MKTAGSVQGVPRNQRFVLLGLAIIVAVVAVIVAGSGGDDDKVDSGPAIIVVRDGKPEGGVQKLRFRKGGEIVFTVRSDEAAEIHLHGYDVAQEVEAGGSTRFAVPAKIDGSFDVEVEESETLIAEVEVVP